MRTLTALTLACGTALLALGPAATTASAQVPGTYPTVPVYNPVYTYPAYSTGYYPMYNPYAGYPYASYPVYPAYTYPTYPAYTYPASYYPPSVPAYTGPYSYTYTYTSYFPRYSGTFPWFRNAFSRVALYGY